MKEAVVLVSRFRFAEAPLLMGRARLYDSHLELTGWSWRGRHRRRLDLDDIAEVKWWRSGRLTLRLTSGEHLELLIEGSGLWKYALEGALGKRFLVCEQLPEHVSRAPAA